MIYLDHAASTSLSSEVLSVLERSFRIHFANSSSSHKLGRDADKIVKESRKHLLKILSAEKNYRLTFLSSATEANNTVIKGISYSEEDEVLYTEADHASVTQCVRFVEDEYGVKSISLGNLQHLSAQSVVAKITPKTKLLVLSHVNNQSGITIPLKEIIQEVKKINSKIHIHIDAVQSFLKLPLSLSELACDSVSLSAHKIGGPKGIAALVVRKQLELKVLLHGGGQEEGHRSSTVSVPLIESFVEATKVNWSGAFSQVQSLKDETIKGLKDGKFEVHFPFTHCEVSPYILSFIVPGISSDIIVRHLEQKEIYISTSSACSSRVKGKSSVFDALGIDEKYHKNVLRISFSYTTTPEQIRQFTSVFSSVMNDLSFLIKR